MKRDYPELVGKKIDVIGYRGSKGKGLIVGCDYWVGITVVDADNLEERLSCLNGPMTKIYQEYFKVTGDDPSVYDAIFERNLKALQNGCMDLRNEVGKRGEGEADGIPADRCAFT